MATDNVQLLARAERLVRLIMRATNRACDSLLDMNAPALVERSRYIVSRDRANRLRTAYADTAQQIRERAR